MLFLSKRMTVAIFWEIFWMVAAKYVAAYTSTDQ
jgi:hypothetical protein